MRKLFLAVVFSAIISGSVNAAQVGIGAGANSPSSIDATTLLSAVTSTGAGTALNLGRVVFDEFTCHVTWGGTTPTNTVVALEGSIDGTTYAALSTTTVTATGQMFHVTDKLIKYIRGNYVSKSGGDGTTAVTLKCSVKAK